jgi:hypothetical protein
MNAFGISKTVEESLVSNKPYIALLVMGRPILRFPLHRLVRGKVPPVKPGTSNSVKAPFRYRTKP